MLHIPARTHWWLVCWLFLLYCSVCVSVRNSFNVCVPPLPLIVLWDHLLHEYRFQNIFLMLPGNVSLCTCAKRGLYLSPCTCFMGLCTLSNNCFTRVNRRLVNSFSYSNRIFWSRKNVIMKFKNKQTKAKRLRLCISCKYSEFGNSAVCFCIWWANSCKDKTNDNDCRLWF